MEPAQEAIERDLARIDVMLAEMNYMQTQTLTNFYKLQAARAKQAYSPAYASGHLTCQAWEYIIRLCGTVD